MFFFCLFFLYISTVGSTFPFFIVEYNFYHRILRDQIYSWHKVQAAHCLPSAFHYILVAVLKRKNKIKIYKKIISLRLKCNKLFKPEKIMEIRQSQSEIIDLIVLCWRLNETVRRLNIHLKSFNPILWQTVFAMLSVFSIHS